MEFTTMIRLLKINALLGLAITLIAPFLLVEASNDANNAEAESSRTEWRIAGPIGGDVRSLVVDQRDPQRFFLGTIDGQIYTSVDGAITWRRLDGFNKPGLYIDQLIIDPRDSNVIYAAAHKHKEPGGFFKSKDGGNNWSEASDLKKEAVHAMAQSASNPDIFYVGTNNGVYRSENAGKDWTKLNTSAYPKLINIESLAIDPRNPDVVYAGTWHLPWKTTDGGKTWIFIKTGMIDDSDVFCIDINPRNPDHVVASACSGIYESRNGGLQWRKMQGIPSSARRTRAILQHPVTPGTILAGTTEGFWHTTNDGAAWKMTTSKQLEINAIAVHPKNPDTVYIGTNNYGVMISRDGGRTFSTSNEGYSGRRAYSVLADREVPNRIYATTINTATGGGFFFVSSDGGRNWQPSMRNMPNRLISYSILQDAQNANVLYLGTNMGVYRSTDRGDSWSPIGPPSSKPVKGKGRTGRAGKTTAPQATSPAAANQREIAKLAQQALIAAGYNVGTPNGVVGPRTTAALRKFQTSKKIPVTGRLDEPTLVALGLAGGKQPMAVSKVRPIVGITDTVNMLAHGVDSQSGTPIILAATTTGLYRSVDPLKGWEQLSYDNGFDRRTLCVSVSIKDPKTIWVGTSTSGVLVSRDGGDTWQSVKDIPTAAPINVIEQDRKKPDHVYIGTGWTLYISTNGGDSWSRRGGDLPLGNYTSVLINPADSDEIYVGNAIEKDGGVYHSTNGGRTWKRIDPLLPSRRIWSLAFDKSNTNKLFIGSHSGGIYVMERRQSDSAHK
jgi:photosystem II stability/assembly factor-like uncharacterized protein